MCAMMNIKKIRRGNKKNEVKQQQQVEVKAKASTTVGEKWKSNAILNQEMKELEIIDLVSIFILFLLMINFFLCCIFVFFFPLFIAWDPRVLHSKKRQESAVEHTQHFMIFWCSFDWCWWTDENVVFHRWKVILFWVRAQLRVNSFLLQSQNRGEKNAF